MPERVQKVLAGAGHGSRRKVEGWIREGRLAIDGRTAQLGDSVTGDEGVITSGALVVTEDSANLDNKTVLITVGRSNLSKRYVFLSITAATESYEVNAITILKKPRTVPVTQPSNVVAKALGIS